MSGQETEVEGQRSEVRWTLVVTALVVGIAFFASGHDFFVSRAVSYTQTADEMEIAASGGNALRRLAFFALGGWGMVLLAIGKCRLNMDWPLVASMSLLLGLAAASFLWADEPEMCLRRLMVLFCGVIGAAGIARAFSLREMSWLVVVTMGTLAVIGVLTEVAIGTFRPWAGDYRFAGTVHPNTQGPALATMCFAALGLTQDGGRWRPLLWLTFGAGAVLLVLTKSRTTTAAFFVSIATVQLVRLPLATKLTGGLAAAWAGALVLWMIWVCGIDPTTDFRDAVLMGRADEAETLSGRAFIWPEVVRYAQERFLLGYGYESFWTPGRIEAISKELGWGLREAHNAYLEVWLWLGAVGIVLLLMVVITAMTAAVRGFRATNNATYTLPVGLVVFGLINAGFESGMVIATLVAFIAGCCLMELGLFGDPVNSIAGTKLGPGRSTTSPLRQFSGSKLVPG